MPYEVDVMDEQGVVKLKFSGESDSVEHNRARECAINLCREREFSKVLVDMTEQESFMAGTTVELYEFGEGFANELFSKDTRIAVVNESGPKRDLHFVVDVARKTGSAGRIRLNSPGSPPTSPKVNVPSAPHRAIRPMIMPKSPTRLTMNALLAAFCALPRSR